MSLEMEGGAAAPSPASEAAAPSAAAKPAWLYKAFVMAGVFSGNLVLTAFIYDFYGLPLNRASSYVVTVGWIVPWLIIYAVHPRSNRQWLMLISGLAVFVVADQAVWALGYLVMQAAALGNALVSMVLVQLAMAAAILGPVIVCFVRLLRREGLLPGRPA